MDQHTRFELDDQARKFFEDLWRRGDYWALESSNFERSRYERLFAAVADRRYGQVLEIGCGAGAFTGTLAGVADRVLGIDVSSAAIERGRRAHGAAVELRQANVMEYDPHPDGPWDLVVLAETMYYIGWLYPFFDVAWLARSLFDSTSPGGRLLLSNTRGELDDMLVQPWVIQTYRDLFVNVGYEVERETVHTGNKDGVDIEVLLTLFEKPG